MKTCYDCIHCEACSDAGDAGFSSLKEDVSKCKHFKNKADFVEVCRCKDCMYFVSGICRQDLALNLSRGDDYCSYGERSDT